MTSSFTSLPSPVSAVIFDCDGTLSTIEGINELANQNGVGALVEELTAQAMGATGINPELYEQRLQLVKPTRDQVMMLGEDYFTHRIPHTLEVITILQRLKKSIYVISAGLYPSVVRFGELLNIPQEHIYAVQVAFDDQGRFVDYDRTSPMTRNDGKRAIISQLKSIHKDIVYVGDGMNDMAVYDLATRFIGFGGAYYRENLAARCEYYVKELSLAPVLSLALTEQEKGNLSREEREMFHLVGG